MKNIFSKIFIVFFALFFASCAPKDNQQTRIRIVDLNGKSRPIVTKVPELNAQALASQGSFTPPPKDIINSVPQQNSAPNQAIPPQQNFALTSPKQTEQNPSETLVTAGEDTNKTIEYDLGQTETAPTKKPEKEKKSAVKKSTKSSTAAASEKATTAKTKGFFVQVGSFTNESNANQTLTKMQSFHEGKIEIGAGEKTIYRVLLGPFANKKQAVAMVYKITSSGHEAIVVRNK